MVRVAEVFDLLRLLADAGAEGAVARARIAEVALAPNVEAHFEVARDLLADELASLAAELLDEVARLESEGVALDADAEGMLALDLALVRVLERVDPDEGASAREGRTTKAVDPALRWELWGDPKKPAGLVRFADVVWSRRVHDRWRRAVDRPPAIVRTVFEPLHRLATGATLDVMRWEIVDRHGERIATRKPDDHDVAAMPVEVVRRGLTAWRSTTARRLVRFLALEAHAGEVRGDLRPDRVRVVGGLSALAERVGSRTHKGAEVVRDALNLGRWIDLTMPGGLDVRGLWTWNQYRAEAPGQPRELVVNLNDAVFLSGAASDMRRLMGDATRNVRRARLLVPVLRHEVPHRLHKHRRHEWGAVWTVADAVLVLFVDRAAELLADGGVRIDSAAWRELVAEGGLDESRAGEVRDLLLGGDGEAPSMLRLVGGDRYTLAEVHAPELAYIVSRGDMAKRERRSRDSGGTPGGANPRRKP